MANWTGCWTRSSPPIKPSGWASSTRAPAATARSRRPEVATREGATTRTHTLTPTTAASEATSPTASNAVQRATDLTGVLTLKHDQLFLLTDAFGDVHADSRGLGLYDGD